MPTLWKRILLISAAVLIAAGCAYWAERAAYYHFREYDAETDVLDVFTDGSEAYGMNNCEINGGTYKVTGGDPFFLVNTHDHDFSRVHILFKEPVSQAVSLQVFYAPEGFISESFSVYQTIAAGSRDGIIPVPEGDYSLLRFDIEQDVNIRKIYVCNGERIVLEDKPNIICIGAVFFVLYYTLCAFMLTITGKKEGPRDNSFITRKPFPAILSCNLFLSVTVIFFQPLIDLLANTRITAFPVWNIWWIQMLVSTGAALILSAIMMILPKKAGWIAALLSLGLGISFLIQSLLFNRAWPFDMNTTWEMKVGCILVWGWIVLFVVTTGYYYLEKKENATKTVIIALVWVLVAAQAVNYAMLSASYGRLAREPGYLNEEQSKQYTESESADLIKLEETVMKVSLYRGMPYLLKDGMSVDDPYNRCFARAEGMEHSVQGAADEADE